MTILCRRVSCLFKSTVSSIQRRNDTQCSPLNSAEMVFPLFHHSFSSRCFHYQHLSTTYFIIHYPYYSSKCVEKSSTQKRCPSMSKILGFRYPFSIINISQLNKKLDSCRVRGSNSSKKRMSITGPSSLLIYIIGRGFGTFFIFPYPYIGKNNPNWLSYFSEGFKVQTTNQIIIVSRVYPLSIINIYQHHIQH